MKQIFLIDVLRNIWKRFISWLSIVTIVLIGTSVILGLYFGYASTSSHADRYLREHNYMDLDIACELGVTSDEVSSIQAIPGVEDAEGVLSFPGQLRHGDTSMGATLITCTDRVSVPYSIEGDVPVSADECALDPELAKKLGATVGDEIDIYVSEARLSNVLTINRFRVSGLARHPDYIEADKENYCILTREAFDTSSSEFDFTNIYVKTDVPENILFFDNKYDEAVNMVKARINEDIGLLAQDRLENLSDKLDAEYSHAKEEADKQLSDAKNRLDSAHDEFDEQISAAKKEIQDAEEELEEGRKKAERELSKAKKQIEDGEKEYNQKISDGEAKIAQGREEMERELGKARVELLDASRKLEEAEETLNAKEVEYREGEQELKNGRRKLDKGWNEYNEGINKLDKTLNIATIDEIIEVLVQFDGTERLVSELNVLKSEGPLERAYHLLAYYDELETELDDIVIGAEFIDTIIETGNEDKEEKIVPEDIVEEIKAVINEFVDIDDFRRNLSRLSDAKKELEDGEKEYKEGKEELRAGREKLDAGWKEFEEGKKKFEGGQEEYNSKEADALKQLADAEAELEDGKKEGARQLAKARETYASEKRKADEQLADYTKKLEEGKEEYNKRKKEGEKELADADQEYEDGKKQAYEQLDELKAQIEEAKSLSCEWIVQTRNTNLYYMELASTCKVLLSVSIVFAAIYALVVAIVCFFTMAIVVEEQTDQIGVCKAFGFYVSEIRIKYLIFGVTAAFTGAIIGDFIAPFVERLITESLSESYIFGIIQHKPVLFPFLILPVGAVLVTSFAVIWSSRKIIARPAVHLLNGSDPNKKPKKKATKENKGGIYTRLIINNFMMDMGRETVSIFIILICCALIGLGTTIRLSYSGAMDQQIDDILIYDISATMTEEITEEERDKFVETISGYPYIGVCKSGGILQNDEGQTLTELYCVEDTESFSEFFALKDKKGEILNVPKEGILATLEMKEKDSLETGSNVTLINKDLHSVEVYPQGFFLLHMGKVIVMSSDYYRELYGEDPVINTYLIKSGESGTDALTEKLYKLDGISDITRTDSIISQYANVTGLYNVLVLVVLGFSIILSFMILLNLSNILVKHRIKELLTMRVNGFAYVQVVGYLVREIIVTTSLGILLGLLVGMPATSAILPAIESNGFMFLRRIFPAAWALAISCNVIFAVIINWLAFKKIKKVPLTDITKY